MATPSIPKRIRWAVEKLEVQPTDHLLEIGCGRGEAVWLICEQLVTGRITALDRSAVMTGAAELRNRQNISSGKATFQTAELATADLKGKRYDKIFAVNVNLFWVRSAARELELVTNRQPQRARFHHADVDGDHRNIGVPAMCRSSSSLSIWLLR